MTSSFSRIYTTIEIAVVGSTEASVLAVMVSADDNAPAPQQLINLDGDLTHD